MFFGGECVVFGVGSAQSLRFLLEILIFSCGLNTK